MDTSPDKAASTPDPRTAIRHLSRHPTIWKDRGMAPLAKSLRAMDPAFSGGDPRAPIHEEYTAITDGTDTLRGYREVGIDGMDTPVQFFSAEHHFSDPVLAKELEKTPGVTIERMSERHKSRRSFAVPELPWKKDREA